MTAESGRHLAINILGRVKGLEKLMPSAGVDYAHVQIGVDGNIRIFLDKTMANTDELTLMFNRVGDTVDEGRMTIYDDLGNEVA